MTKEEERAMFDRVYSDAFLQPSAPRKKRTEEQVSRERTRSRLRKLGDDLIAAADMLEDLHTDGVCGLFASYPLLAKEWNGGYRSPGIGARFERARKEAAQGCALCAEFVAQWEPLFLLCDHLRHESLPQWKPAPFRREITPQMRALFQSGRDSLAWDAMDEMDDGAD